MEKEIKQIDLSKRLFIIAAVLIVGIAGSYVAGIVLDVLNLPVFQPREITISGEGKVFAAPDIAIVQFGVTNECGDEETIPATIGKNAETMNKILKDIKDLGIEEKDITTTQYSLTPRYEYNERTGERVFKGYVIEQDIQVKIRDFTKIGSVLSAGTNNGATLVGNLYFSIDEPEKVRQQAREEAILQAKTKAESIAKASGLKLGKVLNVNESYYPSYGYGGGVTMDKAAMESAPAPEIQPGQQEVSTTVYITYRLR
jgi:hypothetical protein